MVVKGQMTKIVEPVKVKLKYSKQVQVLYQAEGEERPPTWARTSHSQLAWQGSQQVVPGFAICHSTDQVDLLKKKFTLEVSPFHMKNNLEITEIRGCS